MIDAIKIGNTKPVDVVHKEPTSNSFSESNRLRNRAQQIIPGVCHTYANGEDQYLKQSPGFICRGEGCRVLDVDGNEFIEYGMGLGSVTLGHGNKRVVRAAYEAARQGSNFLRPTPLEIYLAEEMLLLLPHGDMIKFGKNGLEVTSAAVKLARIFTGRDLIAVPPNHSFFSVDDWFTCTTAMNAKIAQQVQDLTLHFTYNDIESVQSLFDRHAGKIACLVIDPAEHEAPADNFIHRVIEICHKNGAVFILDETVTGFRWHLNGVQHYYGIRADLSTFGNAMANGYSIAALIGKKEIMEAFDTSHDKEHVSLLSQTYGGETGAMAAAIEAIKIYQEEDVVNYLWKIGRKLEMGISEIINDLGLGGFFKLSGPPCCMVYETNNRDGHPSKAFRTLFLQESIRHGLLIPSLIVSYAHSEQDIEFTLNGMWKALQVYKKALEDGIDNYLEEPSAPPHYRKYS